MRVTIKSAIVTIGVLLLARPAVAITIDMVTVGNPGNPNDPADCDMYDSSVTHCGAVSYAYQIGKYDVTNSQYVEFLNAKAKSDPLGLYNTAMGSGWGGIIRSGPEDSYIYSTIAGRVDMPVNSVGYFDALRFANWLNNGQGNGDTESGTYTLLGGTPIPSNSTSITRIPGAKWFIPSHNEWYKAAYHKNDGPTSNYFLYPTSSNATPIASAPTALANHANYSDVVGDVTVVGAYTMTMSPYGAFDMAGNVFNVVEDLVFRGGQWWPRMRGGSYDFGEDRLISSGASLGSFESENPWYGFRVASLPGPPGDCNHNGVVDAADYILWRNNPTGYGGDPAGYNTWRSNFGNSIYSGMGAIAIDPIPEPAWFVLAISSVVGLAGVYFGRPPRLA